MFVARPVCVVLACVRAWGHDRPDDTEPMVAVGLSLYLQTQRSAGVQDGTLSERLGDGGVSVFFCRRPTSMRAPRHSLQVQAAVARC